MNPGNLTDRRHSVWFYVVLTVLLVALAACGTPEETPAPSSPSAPPPGTAPNQMDPPSTPIAADQLDAEIPRIVYDGTQFTPKRLDIEVGQQVAFVNESEKTMWPASNIHPTHEIYPEFDAQMPLENGQAWVFTFTKAGFWRYHNHMANEIAGMVAATGGEVEQVPLVIGNTDLTFPTPENIPVDDYVNLYRSDTLVEQYVRKYGPYNTVQLAREAAEKYIKADCHQRSHTIGRAAYKIFGAAAFSLAAHECQSGSLHGATEALFRDRGVTTLKDDVAVLCGSTSNAFDHHNCVHGVGHGLMAWTSYEIFDTLDMCDQLEPEIDRLSCYSGAFMENVVGGLSGSMGHVTTYLSEDPHFPCNILERKYVSPCYFYQTSRMATLFKHDMSKIGEACLDAPEYAYRDCFLSFGRDVGNATRGEPLKAIEICNEVENIENRSGCMEGAVQDRFWDVSGASEALIFCRAVEGDLIKQRCYMTIIYRARDLYTSQDAFDNFCAQVEEHYRQWACRQS